jgi:precorrin-6Y C5,15-methyltransferase (decarboxylating)
MRIGSDPRRKENAAAGRWLSIVGIGEDGINGLSVEARRLIASAEIVFGGKRHLALVASLIQGEVRTWPSPFEGAIAEVLRLRNRPVCVLASGDPFQHGVGSVLARHIDPQEMAAVPAPSAFSLAAARLAWALPETTLISLHAREPDLLRPHLHPRARVLALTSDGEAPAAVAGLLVQLGFGASRLIVLEALGGARERVRATTAAGFNLDDIDPLNTVAIETAASPDARIIARAAGLADDLFEHDGQLTKREVRAITLSALSPRRGELLWDIGAGAGSIAIEWMLADPSMRAVAIEARPDRVARIRRNAAALGVPALDVCMGQAPAALRGLPGPDAIFIGCGTGERGLIETAMVALRTGGRLVVNAVTLATETCLIGQHGKHGGALVRIAIARAAPLGRTMGWRPARPVTQWTWVKR